MKTKTLCFTGNRPEKIMNPWNESHISVRRLKSTIRRTIDAQIHAGYTHFLTGMARGIDIICGELIFELKKKHPNIVLVAVIPYQNQSQAWEKNWQRRYDKLLSRCDKTVLLSETYYQGCLLRRNDYMVEQSSHIICVYRTLKGGTGYTYKKARQAGLQITEIPVTFHSFPLGTAGKE